MEFWPEREKSVDPFREVWELVLYQSRRNLFVCGALVRANRLCIPLLEPTGPIGFFLKFEDKAEWQIFYTYLLERFVRTDEKNEETLWRNTCKVIGPVRVELLKELTLPAIKAKEWLIKTDNAAQMIVAVQRSGDIEPERKTSQIVGLAERFNRELKKIRGQVD